MAEECAACGESFGSAEALVRHVKEVHANEAPGASLERNPESHTAGLVCALCGIRLRTPAEMARHNLSPHAPSRPARRGRPTA
jgi:hypothetical protein